MSFTFSSPDVTATFECQLDGGGYTTCTSGVSYSGLADGSHTFAVRAVDPVGNVDATPATSTWTIDTTIPDTNLLTHPNALSNVATAAFTFDSATSNVTFECRLDGAAYAACTSPDSYASLNDGDHTFDVRSRTSAGVVDPSPASFTWTIDTVAPDTSFATQPSTEYATPTPTFTFQSNDSAATFECSLDGASYADCPASYTTSTLALGVHDLSVRAKDVAGNVDATPATAEFTIVLPMDAGMADAGPDGGADAGDDGGTDAGVDGGHGGVEGGCNCRAAGPSGRSAATPFGLSLLVLGLAFVRSRKRRAAVDRS